MPDTVLWTQVPSTSTGFTASAATDLGRKMFPKSRIFTAQALSSPFCPKQCGATARVTQRPLQSSEQPSFPRRELLIGCLGPQGNFRSQKQNFQNRLVSLQKGPTELPVPLPGEDMAGQYHRDPASPRNCPWLHPGLILGLQPLRSRRVRLCGFPAASAAVLHQGHETETRLPLKTSKFPAKGS